MTTYAIDHEDSPVAELREAGGQAEDSQARFPAAIIDPAAQLPLTATADFTIDGQPIAWLSSARDHLVMDGAAFAPLRRVEPTRLTPGEHTTVGRVTAAAREALGPRRVVELLLRTGAIATYWHLGADLCLRAEATTEGRYGADFDAVHHYATRRRRAQSYAFSVAIDEHGEVVVSGRAAASR